MRMQGKQVKMQNFGGREAAVVAPGQLHPAYDGALAGAAHVIERDGRYLMVYWGRDEAGRNYILQASSPVERPNDWTPFGRPLLEPQPDEPYNSRGPGFPFLLPVTKDYWLLYFCGWGQGRPDGKLPNTTGVAVSEDGGVTWRYSAGHLPLDRPYDREGTGSVWVCLEEGRFRLYYTAIGTYYPRPAGVQSGHGDTIPMIGVAYAESEDGLHWEKPLDDWVVKPRAGGVEPYEYICSKPCVIAHGGGYTMWVNTFGTAYRVHRLTSADGIYWQWADRVGADGELGVGEAGAFDDHQRSYPTVVQYRGGYRCWYTGNGFGTGGMGYLRGRGLGGRCGRRK